MPLGASAATGVPDAASECSCSTCSCSTCGTVLLAICAGALRTSSVMAWVPVGPTLFFTKPCDDSPPPEPPRPRRPRDDVDPFCDPDDEPIGSGERCLNTGS